MVMGGKVNELACDQQEGWRDRSGTPPAPQPRLMLGAVYYYEAHLSHLSTAGS